MTDNFKISYIPKGVLTQAVANIDDGGGFTSNLLAGAKRLDDISPRGTNGLYEVSDFQDTEGTLRAGQATLLTPEEQKGAVTLLSLLRDAPITSAEVPVQPGQIVIPARRSAITVADVEAAVAKSELVTSFGNRVGNASFDAKTRELNPAYSSYESKVYVDLIALAKRIASTHTGSDDGNSTNIVPSQLKARDISNDPYPNDGLYSELSTRLTAAEQNAALYLYDHFFNPKPEASAPYTQETAPIVTLPGINNSSLTVRLERNVSTDLRSKKTTARTDAFIIRGLPGTSILLGKVGDVVKYDQALVIPTDGVLRLPFGNYSNGFAAVALQDPDGTGVLSPTIVGPFAIQAPSSVSVDLP